MNSPPDAVYAAVRDTDPDVLDSDGLDSFMHRIAELQAWCEARQVRATRRRRALAAEGRSPDARSALTGAGRRSSRDARAAADRETVCTAMPGFEQALSSGGVSPGHVDAVAAATRRLDHETFAEFVAQADLLLERAGCRSVDTFERECRDLAAALQARHNSRADADELEQQRARSKVTRWVDRQTGMHATLIEADPVTDRRFWSAVQAERKRLRRSRQAPAVSWDRLTVDALVGAVSPASGRPTVEANLVVHVDLATLTEGRHDASLCETDSGAAIPVDTARRLACTAGIIPVVLDGAGVALDEGRAKRLATPEQRRALEAMQATCSHPDCTVSIDDCIVHHLDPWSRNGRTDLARMAPLCDTHHHLVHEGGWTFDITPDRFGVWTRPDGRGYWSGSLLDRRPGHRPSGADRDHPDRQAHGTRPVPATA